MTQTSVFPDRRPGRWRSYVSVAAVAYLLASLVPLIWILWQVGGWINGDATVFKTTIDGELYATVGLTYRGDAGSVLIWTELVGVSIALTLSFIRRPWPRKIGHALLLVWAGLLFANAWRIVLASDLQMLRGAIVLVTLGTLAVLGRVLWGPPRDEASVTERGGVLVEPR